MRTALNSLNIIFIIALAIILCFLTAVFFLGSFETYNELRKNLPTSFFQRALLGLLTGVVGSMILISINLIYNTTVGKREGIINIRRLTIILGITVVVSSLIGSFIFFAN